MPIAVRLTSELVRVRVRVRVRVSLTSKLVRVRVRVRVGVSLTSELVKKPPSPTGTLRARIASGRAGTLAANALASAVLFSRTARPRSERRARSLWILSYSETAAWGSPALRVMLAAESLACMYACTHVCHACMPWHGMACHACMPCQYVCHDMLAAESLASRRPLME